MTVKAFTRLAAGFGLMVFLAACEIEVGDGPSANDGGDATPADNNPQPTPNNNNNNNGGNKPDPDPDPDPVGKAPGVPGALSPGNGENFTGGGAKVTFVWTDAEGAAEFELLVQGLGSGGWQTAAHQVTDSFQHTITLNNTAWTQYRWAVRSIGADSQVSAYTSWRSFTWAP